MGNESLTLNSGIGLGTWTTIPTNNYNRELTNIEKAYLKSLGLKNLILTVLWLEHY